VKIRRVFCLTVFVSAAALTGCRGDRVTTFIEQPTDERRWRVDGTLIRSYNVTLQQAYDSVLKLADRKKWVVTDTASGQYTADIDVRTVERVEINFDIWAPPGKATDIGIEYAGGDKIGSAAVFSDLERYLPGKRITVNQPK
jgi:hypothetical protein